MVQSSQRPLRVLVADDNAANCKILKNVLEVAGHQVEIATARYWTTMERHKLYISEHGHDMPEVENWRWSL